MNTWRSTLVRHLACAALLISGCNPESFDAKPELEDGSISPSTNSDAGKSSERDSSVPMDAAIAANEDASPSDAGAMDAQAATPRDAASSLAREADAAPAPRDSGAPDVAQPPMCIDTVSDPKNCGSCGFDCTAPSAVVSCQSSMCVRTCAPGYGDCNGDLVHGSSGNGCELRIDSDANNCGGCRRRCAAPAEGIASCRERVCVGHVLENDYVSTGVAHGTATGGGAFTLRCAPGEVVTGVRGVADEGKVYSVQLACAGLRLTRSSGSLLVSTSPAPSTASSTTNLTWKPDDYVLSCPPNSVVTTLAGATHRFSGSTEASVSRLALTCSSISLSPDRTKITLTPGQTLTVGAEDPPNFVERFADACGADGALQGVSGRNGAYLDAIATMCGRLQVHDSAVTVVETPKDAVTGAEE